MTVNIFAAYPDIDPNNVKTLTFTFTVKVNPCQVIALYPFDFNTNYVFTKGTTTVQQTDPIVFVEYPQTCGYPQ